MRYCVTSHWNGNLPEIPHCDLLLIAGDICPLWLGDQGLAQSKWLEDSLAPHLYNSAAKRIVFTPGPRDWVFQKCPHLIDYNELGMEVLVDAFCEVEGKRIYGCPWSHKFEPGAYTLNKAALNFVHMNLPIDVDIMLTPRSFYDYTLSPPPIKQPPFLLEWTCKSNAELLLTGDIDSPIWDFDPGMSVMSCPYLGGSHEIRDELFVIEDLE